MVTIISSLLSVELFIVELPFVVYSCLHIQLCALDFYKSKEEKKSLLDAALTTLLCMCICVHVHICVCLCVPFYQHKTEGTKD